MPRIRVPRIVGITEFDATGDTAGTGGIRYISREMSAKQDEYQIYTVAGRILPPLSKRKNFQGESRYFQRNELGLSDDWELAHLWPPRFGDEAAAGIMWAPKLMNQSLQNHKVEPWLQRLKATSPNIPIEITISAASWNPEFLRRKGNPDYKGAEFMKWVHYEITNCPTGTQSPAGGPLLGTSIFMQLEPIQPGHPPKLVTLNSDTLLSWQ